MISKFFIADSNVFYLGIPFQSSSDILFVITSPIRDEIKHIRKNIHGFETLISAGRVSVIDPSQESFNTLKEIGSSFEVSRLSDADLSLIALARELKYPIISSDYTLANLAKKLSLEVIIPGKDRFKIKSMKHYCSICRSFTGTLAPYCNICGNKVILKRIK